MSDLIGRNATEQEMVKTIARMMATKCWMRRDKNNEDEILAVIQKAPAIDAVEVVRCHKCRHSKEPDSIRLRRESPNALKCMNPDSPCFNRRVWRYEFCSSGERRGENGETSSDS